MLNNCHKFNTLISHKLKYLLIKLQIINTEYITIKNKEK